MILHLAVAAASVAPCTGIRLTVTNPAGGVMTADVLFVTVHGDGSISALGSPDEPPTRVPASLIQSIEVGATPLPVDAPYAVRVADRELWAKRHEVCRALRKAAADEAVREIEDAIDEERAKALKKIEGESLTFTLPKAKAGDAWGRANVFVAKYASMKTQVSTDYAVETYSPHGDGQAFGYQITRTPDGAVTKFEIVVTTNQPEMPTAQRRALFNGRIAAHYIRTGVLVCEKCISK